MFKFKRKKKEKPKIHYRSMEDILRGIRITHECGFKEKVFDWGEISLKGFFNRRKIIKMCKPYGKIRRVRYGFIIKFNQEL